MRTFLVSTCLLLGLSLNALAAKNPCISHLTPPESPMLNVMNCHLTDADVPALVQFLNQHSDIRSLYAINNQIGDEGAKTLQQASYLAAIILDNNKITDAGAQAFAKINLYKLSLNHNQITDKGAIALANSNTKVIQLNQNQITDIGAAALGESITHEELELNDNQITDAGIKSFERNYAYFKISLAGNHITDQGAKSLATLPKLLILNLENNQITNAGVAAILKSKADISSLKIKKNLLTDDVVKLFVDRYFYSLSLGSNLTDKSVPTLLKTRAQKMDLSDNQFTDKGAMQLVNVPTSELSLAGNPISDKTAIYFSAQHRHFQLLDFSRTGLTDQGAIAIGTGNYCFEIILAHNQLTDIAAKAIAAKAGSIYLDISYNHISPIGMAALKSNPYIYITASEGNDGLSNLSTIS